MQTDAHKPTRARRHISAYHKAPRKILPTTNLRLVDGAPTTARAPSHGGDQDERRKRPRNPHTRTRAHVRTQETSRLADRSQKMFHSSTVNESQSNRMHADKAPARPSNYAPAAQSMTHTRSAQESSSRTPNNAKITRRTKPTQNKSENARTQHAKKVLNGSETVPKSTLVESQFYLFSCIQRTPQRRTTAKGIFKS